jgi:hypothetical protein
MPQTITLKDSWKEIKTVDGVRVIEIGTAEKVLPSSVDRITEPSLVASKKALQDQITSLEAQIASVQTEIEKVDEYLAMFN